MRKKTIAVVGAGISGLVIAYELLKRGADVVLLEKDNRVGGLAKTFEYRGNKFDIGPHRFYSGKKSIIDYIHRIMKRELMKIERESLIFCKGKYFNWPLTFRDVFNLNLKMLSLIGYDFFSKMLDNEVRNPANFEDYIIQNYGQTIYEMFFKSLTSKFLSYPPEKIHPRWAEVGIQKAIIEEEIYSRNLKDLLRMLLRGVKTSTSFFYPPEGIGKFTETLCSLIRENRGVIETDVKIKALVVEDGIIKNIITQQGSIIPSLVIWTAPLTDLAQLLGYRDLNLIYRDLLLFGCLFKRKDLLKRFQWCYYSDEEILFHRISIPYYFSSQMSSGDKIFLVAEVSCKKEDFSWRHPGELIERVLIDLKKVSLIPEHSLPLDVIIKKVENAYPVYKLDFLQRKKEILDYLRKFKNLKLGGRQGLFWYNNMDECISQALKIAEEVSFLI